LNAGKSWSKILLKIIGYQLVNLFHEKGLGSVVYKIFVQNYGVLNISWHSDIILKKVVS